MTHPVIGSFPSTGTWTPLTIRQSLAAGFGWTITDADDVRNLDIGAAALTINAVILSGNIFTYDSTDTTTADDGVTCIVSSDGKRFKTGSIGSAPIAVKSRTTATPPGSPTLGDWYRIPAAPTGNWASNADDLTVYTGSGWQFVSPSVGVILYVRDESGYEHWSEGGAWVSGIGAASILDGSIVAKKLEWPLGIAVEAEQAAPPGGTPSAGTSYIVGASATGDWAGHDTKVARADGAGAWEFITAYEGGQVYNKGINARVVFKSGVWETIAGSYVQRIQDVDDAAASQTIEDSGYVFQTSTGYQYSSTTPPKTSDAGRVIDLYTQSVTAKKANAEFEYEFDGRVRFQLYGDSGTSKTLTLTAIGLFVDTEVNARDWFPTDEIAAKSGASLDWSNWSQFYKRTLLYIAADTSAHTLKLRFFFRVTAGSGEELQINDFEMERRRSIIREAD